LSGPKHRLRDDSHIVTSLDGLSALESRLRPKALNPSPGEMSLSTRKWRTRRVSTSCGFAEALKGKSRRLWRPKIESLFRYLVYLNNRASGKHVVKTMGLVDQKAAP
jgi:hypothetical protein